jgi:hypothetical protein
VPLLRVGQVLAHVTPFQDVATEEPQRTDLRDHRPDRETAILEEEQVVASGWVAWSDRAAHPCAGETSQRPGRSCGWWWRRSRDALTRRAGIAAAWSQTPPVTIHPILLRVTWLPVGRRASGYVQVAKGTAIPPQPVVESSRSRRCWHDWGRRLIDNGDRFPERVDEAFLQEDACLS